MANSPSTPDFERMLDLALRIRQGNGHPHADIVAKDIHRIVGDYPNSQRHRMPACNKVMRKAMKKGDQILSEPPEGQGASLKIRYLFPR